MTDELLPELPTPHSIRPNSGARLYTEAQMHAYAREAIRLAHADAARYRKLKPMLFAADFDYHTGVDRICALIFQIPDDARVSADLDGTIDAFPSPPAGEVA